MIFFDKYSLLKYLIMERKCCVVNCKENYNKQTKVKFYRLPRNLEERQKWLTIIPRENIPDTKNIVVWEKHWSENYPTKLDYGKGRPRDPPSVFTCVKPSQVPILPQRKRSNVKAFAEVRNFLPDESDHFSEKDKIKNFKDFSVDVNGVS